MTTPAFSPRILAALGITASDITAEADHLFAAVDHADRRFRDAIKAGALPVDPPATIDDHRAARITDPTTHTTLTIRSPLPNPG